MQSDSPLGNLPPSVGSVATTVGETSSARRFSFTNEPGLGSFLFLCQKPSRSQLAANVVCTVTIVVVEYALLEA